MLATDKAFAVIALASKPPRILAIFTMEDEAFDYAGHKAFSCGVFPCEGAVSFSLATKHRIEVNKADPEKVIFLEEKKV